MAAAHSEYDTGLWLSAVCGLEPCWDALLRVRSIYGDTPQLSANQFFYGLRQEEEHRVLLEPGLELLIGLEAISKPDEQGMRTL